MEPNLFAQPVQAELARALAQAVAGYYGQSLYFTASFTQLQNSSSPYDISPAYDSYQEAADSLLQSPPLEGYGVFGPFQNGMEGISPPSDQAVVTGITVTTTDGNKFELPNEWIGMPDAIFFSMEAVQKFAVPYYSIVYAANWAQGLLSVFNQSELAMMVHLPWSESVDLDAEGQPEEFKMVAQGFSLVLSPP